VITNRKEGKGKPPRLGYFPRQDILKDIQNLLYSRRLKRERVKPVTLCSEWVECSSVIGQFTAETAQYRPVGRIQSHRPHQQTPTFQRRPPGICTRKRRPLFHGEYVTVTVTWGL